jgi:hypothetical protein
MSSNITFHENVSSGSRVVPCGETDMKNLIAGFQNFENAPKRGAFDSTGTIAKLFIRTV